KMHESSYGHRGHDVGILVCSIFHSKLNLAGGQYHQLIGIECGACISPEENLAIPQLPVQRIGKLAEVYPGADGKRIGERKSRTVGYPNASRTEAVLTRELKSLAADAA